MTETAFWFGLGLMIAGVLFVLLQAVGWWIG
jgi:hypothetical protein